MRPMISVVMPVRDAGSTVAAAAASMLAQSLRDIELIVVDDGSRDDSIEQVLRLGDDRLRVVRAPRPLGIAAALNLGLRHCRGGLIARMDADDISVPERLELQEGWLRRHPEVAILGSWAVRLMHDGRRDGFVRPPTCHRAIVAQMPLRCPIIHPTVLVRREVYEAMAGYRQVARAEDLDLWWRAHRRFRLANVPCSLVEYRWHAPGAAATLAAAGSIARLCRRHPGIWSAAYAAGRYAVVNLVRGLRQP